MIAKKLFIRKEYLDILVLPLVVILVAAAAFALGRISAFEEQKPQLKIHYDQTL